MKVITDIHVKMKFYTNIYSLKQTLHYVQPEIPFMDIPSIDQKWLIVKSKLLSVSVYRTGIWG